MVRFLCILLTTFSIISCEDNEDNQVALRAEIDDVSYVASGARAAKNEDGTVSVQGLTGEESILLRIPSVNPGTYLLGGEGGNLGIYENRQGVTFNTQLAGEGEVVITEFNSGTNTVTGNFNFTAISAGIDTVYVENGFIYQIPYVDEPMADPTAAGSFTAKIDGSSFLPIYVTARRRNNSIQVTGGSSNNIIGFIFRNTITAGTYELPNAIVQARYQSNDGNNGAEAGEVTITEHNTSTMNIRGTFSFITDLNEISEGSFNVTYQ
ncbi:DUF6252 family protein [Aequorivita echinoideorum]|uniref:Uncharacterized protein n=1 Tax=Aequorivita echinoideorum TaxID=1549647 RepID=A0ABS5S306_9FLAO|nr:DUF6252 family protein [Aequorivita echinoideorum]MBT0606840.1 hypothetical protein [Aequorivita echinoideorum]